MEDGKSHIEDFYISVLGKGPVSQHIYTTAVSKNICSVLPIGEKATKENLLESFEKSNIVIFPSEEHELELELEINKLSLFLNKAVCYVRLEQDISIVSLVIPGVTPCYLCACFRRLACTKNASDRLTRIPTIGNLSGDRSRIRAEISRLACNLVESYRDKRWSYSNFSDAFVIVNRTCEIQKAVFMRRDDCPLCSTQQFHKGSSEGSLVIPFASKLDKLINPYFGIIKEVEEIDTIYMPREITEKPIISCAKLSNYRLYQSGQEALISYGKGWNYTDSLCSAVGEAIERYSSYCWQPNKLVHSKASQLQDACCPRKLSLYKDYQYQKIPYVEYHDEMSLTWVEGEAVLAEKSALVPALAIFSDWDESDKEPRIFECTTSGLASGLSQEMAFNNALLELVERDAFILAWMLRLEGTRLDLQSYPRRRIRQLIEFHEALGVELFLIQIPSDSPAKVIAAFFVSRYPNKSEPAVTMGLGISSSLEDAVERAVLELVQVFYLLRERLKDARVLGIVDALASGELQITQPIHHGLYYCHEIAKEKIRHFIDCQTDKSPVWQSEDNLFTLSSNILDWISAMKGEVFMVNLTPKSLQEIGFYTVKVVATNLQPIHFGKNKERLESLRLQRILRDSRLDYSMLNRDVHPLS